MLVGAGTVLTTKQVDEAMDAGAKFIVSPGFDPEIVDYCQKKGIEIFPGCVSPSEVAQAVKKGLKVVKFFPAEQAGGIDMIKAMALSLIHISEPTRRTPISYAVFCLKKKKKKHTN